MITFPSTNDIDGRSQKEPKLTYALDAVGRMVCISKVARGLACNCHCPKCNESLVAKLGHEGGRQAHFAHQKGSDCHGAYMTALHRLAEQIIEEEKMVMVPVYKTISAQKLSFQTVEVEQRLERKDLQPDLVGETDDGLRWFIEIRNTHEVDAIKKRKLIESGITCLEIDVREQTLDNLKSFLLESTDNREWLNNPNYDSWIVSAKQAKVSLIEGYLLEKPDLLLPKYMDYDCQRITLSEVSKLFSSEDGLCTKLKVVSTDGIPYIIVVGCREDIENYNTSLGNRKTCNELIIYTDNLSQDADILSSNIDIKWNYHYLSEKEREARLNEYRQNPKYEIKPTSFCAHQCRYNHFFGKCIYKKATISDYVICNKEKRQRDESEVASKKQIPHKFSISNISQHEDKNYEEDTYSERYPHQLPTIPTKRIEQELYHREIQLDANLPFETFWTVDDYYNHLQSTNSLKTEAGYLAEVIKSEKINGRIIVLSRDPNTIKTIYPYHISIITVSNGDILQNKVADFINRKSAMDAYYERLNAMRRHSITTEDNCGLPF